ncbi:hypothetical protein [Microbulbifer magnicolonia]|uniref:hypothetical protein n=1 Tax=Microbulbifer magnicolonia TaxID=3109744 RepID=UPI002B407B73|nr:hypothetical protein [Microbulbifer sp. GG15]
MSDRSAYEKKLQAKLDQRKADIDKLRARAREADANARIALNSQADELERRHSELKHQLHQVAEASDDAWDSVKEGAEAAWRKMESAFDKARQKLRH